MQFTLSQDDQEEPDAEAGNEPSSDLADEKRRNEELLTRLKYLQADFENYRKRADKEMQEAEEASVRKLAASLLSVLDELELASSHLDEKKGDPELREGIKMVNKNLMSALESVGLQRIEAIGKPFDPTMHEAVEKVHGRKGGSDIVVEEVRQGFKFRGRVLRPSMVKVEVASTKADQEAKASE